MHRDTVKGLCNRMYLKNNVIIVQNKTNANGTIHQVIAMYTAMLY